MKFGLCCFEDHIMMALANLWPACQAQSAQQQRLPAALKLCFSEILSRFPAPTHAMSCCDE